MNVGEQEKILWTCRRHQCWIKFSTLNEFYGKYCDKTSKSQLKIIEKKERPFRWKLEAYKLRFVSTREVKEGENNLQISQAAKIAYDQYIYWIQKLENSTNRRFVIKF